jgi:outer membrane protein assembly factor BamD
MFNKSSNPVFTNILFLFVIFLAISLSACSYIKSSVQDEPVFEPEASLQKANELIEKGYYEDAREILETIKAKDATQKYSIIAKLRIADSYYEDELYEEAVTEYENYLSIHQHHKLAPYAQYQLAMSFFKRIKTVDVSYSLAQKALIEFEKLRQQYPRNPYMDITESRIKICIRVLAEHEFYVGQFYFKKGSYEAALNRLNEMLQNYPDSKKESEALYYIAISYENLGDRDKAINTLNALIEKFPTIELSVKAKKLIASFNNKK